MIDLSMLNEGQRQAVSFGEGPLLVLAGAGSGKTRVLTYRIAHLIKQGEEPDSFFVSTFTKKAATEMTERLVDLIGQDAIDKVQIGTFHSFCFHVLKVDSGRKFEVLRDYEQKKIFKGLLAPPSKEYPNALNWAIDVGQAMSVISRSKNELISVEKYAEQAGIDANTNKMVQLYRLYERYKSEQGKIDFDDMLLWCYKLFRDDPAILAKYQQKFKWLLVDESQDNNLAQWEITKMLAYPRHNITVVGDDDQGIYGFRGARPDQILAFDALFEGAKRITLGENYRSTSEIVDMATTLIANNAVRFKKRLVSMAGAGQEPVYIASEAPEDEASIVCNELETLFKQGIKGRDIAILYRTNAQSRAFEDELVKRDIPYTIIGSAGFYARKEIKDIISYLRVINWPHDSREEFERIINVPTRFLGKAFISQVSTYAYKAGLSFFDAMTQTPGLKRFQYEKADTFHFHITRLHDLVDDFTPSELIYEVRRVFGYDAWLLKEEGAEEGADNNRIENLNELASAASRFPSLTAFLDFVAKQQSKSNSDSPGEDKVQLMTIHRSKGLEWHVVFLAGVSQGLLPHKNSMQYGDDGEFISGSVEEERRLCYVGVTRARRILYMSSVNSWQSNPLMPSMFLGEMGIGTENIQPELVEASR